MTGPEAELARTQLEAAGVEARLVAPAALPLAGTLAERAASRVAATAALALARAHFVATRYEEARAAAAAADRAAGPWAGAADVAPLLAELALVAAEAGDPDAFARAAARHPGLALDPARWSPDARGGYARACAARAAAPAGLVALDSAPPGATLFVDGADAGRTPASLRLPAGRHALVLELAGAAPAAALVDVDPVAGARLTIPLAPLGGSERLAALRLDLEAGGEPAAGALALAAAALGADAALALVVAPEGASAVVEGGDVDRARFARAGERLAALRQVVAEAGRHVAARCALLHVPPPRARAGRALTLELEPGRCVARLRGAYRSVPARPTRSGAWTPLVGASRAGPLRLPLPSSARPLVVEYFVEGETLLGHTISGAGSALAPLRLLVEADLSAPPPRRWYRSPWVWGLAGAAAVATAALAVLALRPGSDARLVGDP